jgi:dinuclear metal center YbgI/SA1388 family protein
MEDERVNAPRLSRIVEMADRLFPFQEAEPWDNVGIQIGDPQRTISGVAFGLDATPETVQFAASRSCQLLITHHPVILDPIRTIQPDNLPGRTVLSAARAGVDILSLHTNLDAAPGGLNDYLAERLGLSEVTVPVPARCARLGQLPAEMTLHELADLVARKLRVAHTRIVANANSSVRSVFVVSGSGMGYLHDALRYKADVMITGDVRHHAAKDALELGMPVIDAGHYGLEKYAAEVLAAAFHGQFQTLGLDVKCIVCDIEQEPFLNIYHREEDFTLERATSAP